MACVSSPNTPRDSPTSSGGSDSSSTAEEERIRRLFQTCDGDGDGYINSNDLLMICRQLNMEDAVDEIMRQLGADDQGRISYTEFVRCRMQLRGEIDALQEREQEPNMASSPHADNWPSSSNNSLGATSLKHESWEFDSGARDLSPEPNTLHKLIEAAGGSITGSSQNLLDLANKLHLAALSSLKGEIIDLNTRLQHVSHERDLMEKQLNKTQLERLRLVQENDTRLEQQAQRYEERITELHSVIAELSKKIEHQRINVIREEDEYSQRSENRSHGTSNDNNPNESCTDNEEINGEVPSITESGMNAQQLPAMADKEVSTSLQGDGDSLEERAIQFCKEMENLHFEAPQPPQQQQQHSSSSSVHLVQLQEEMQLLRTENSTLQEQLGRQEAELNKMRASVGSIREERDRFRRKMRELQSKLQSVQSQSSQGSQTGSPTRSKSPYVNSTTGERTPTSREEAPIAKIAERVKLKKMESGDRHILGSEITSIGISNSKVAEHLVQPLQEDSSTQEIFQGLYSTGSQVSESKIREFEVETERLHSRIEHLKSQNDLLALTLEESKSQCDRLSVLIGKYESNNTALQLALSYSDQAFEAYEALIGLLESEMGLLLSNCRAAGLGALTRQQNSYSRDGGGDLTEDDHEEVASLLRRAHDNRKSAETVAKHLLQRVERNCGLVCGVLGCSASPWEDLSSHSHTTSTSSTSSSCDNDFSKGDEQRLRDHIIQLKSDRAAVRTTILELESVHIDPLSREPSSSLDAQKLDLENAVLMQELMAMKEEKAELKAQVYLLERERAALELRLSSRDAQEQAYLAHIEHLKSEMKEQLQITEKMKEGYRNIQNGHSDVNLGNIETCGDLSQDLSEALRREKKLKQRLQELVATLEKVTKNSELRHQQSAEFVNDLKRANSALVAAFEKSKKKYLSKVKKMEQQMLLMVDRHSAQVRMLKQRIAMLEEESTSRGLQPAASETSL